MEATFETTGNGKVNGNVNGNGVCKVNGNGNGNGNGVYRNDDVIVNLDRGDPKVYYPFWKKMDEKCAVTIKASEMMSYFAEGVDGGGCFYQMPEFTAAVNNIHRVVGNSVVEGRHIIGGTGSSQLFTAALRSLASTVCPSDLPLPVVCAQPFYSCYQEALEEERSEKYEWKGDAKMFKEDGAYVEVVTTPNNPDGSLREAVVKREGGMLIADLAYYWPQYTPITGPVDYDIMLFTLSKATGHAGSRVGWAIVKDKQVAANMVKQMALMSIGMCREGQLRAAKILDFVAASYEHQLSPKEVGLFEFGQLALAQRWARLRAAVKCSGTFKLLEFPSQYCNFFGKRFHPNPAYAWMESRTGEDAAEMLKKLNILTRNGGRFGALAKYTRVSMLESDETFNLFIQRLSMV